MLRVGTHCYGYAAWHIDGDGMGKRFLGETISDAIRLAYQLDEREINRHAKDRVASEYRARCAEQDRVTT